METYKPEEIKELIKMLNSINAKVKKSKADGYTRLEKQIRYLEQRLKFFNPTKEMLGYVIDQARRSKVKISPELLEKLKSEYEKK